MFTRRAFLTSGALVAGAGAMGLLGGCSPQGSAEKPSASAEAPTSGGITAETVLQPWAFEIAPDPIDDSQIAETVEADVVVVGDRAELLVLAECKAPEIRIGERTLAQAVRYNSVLGARYVILTNGLRHYCCECRDGEYVQLGGFPDLSGD